MGTIIEHLMNDHGVTMEQAKAALKGWDVKPLIMNGHAVGEYMVKNNEAHIAIDKRFRKLLGRRGWREQGVKQILDGRDFLVTKLFHGDKYRKLIEFIGFKFTHADAKYDYFWLDSETIKCWQ